MRLTITEAALQEFQTEWGFESGDQVRVFVRYGGGGSDPFTFGITREKPFRAALTDQHEGIEFFMEEGDTWMLEEGDLTIDLQRGEIAFIRQNH